MPDWYDTLRRRARTRWGAAVIDGDDVWERVVTCGDLGYHVIHGQDLLDSLHRVGAGDDADAVYAELWANAEHEQVPPATGHGEPS